MRLTVIALASLLTAWPAAAQDKPQNAPAPEGGKDVTAILRGVDKITARTEELRADVGTVIAFHDLEILANRCYSEPSRGGTRHAALLDIYENAPGEEPRRLFSGWMFSDSPSLTSLEHPYYDVAVLACAPREEKDEDKKKEKQPDEKKSSPGL